MEWKFSNWKLGAEYFWNEFTLNYLMATYSKTQVSILNGIVMGGGAGASIHGRFRVATENSVWLFYLHNVIVVCRLLLAPYVFIRDIFFKVFAMPETALGLFPDVGASYYLSRLPGFFGEYVGLTGARLDGAEMVACGLATHFMPSERLTSLEEALHKVDSGDSMVVSAIIEEFSLLPTLKEKSAYHRVRNLMDFDGLRLLFTAEFLFFKSLLLCRLDIIDRCFSSRTIEEILSALESEADKSKDDWLSLTIQALKKASPTSLKISLRSIREGRLQGVGQCLVRDYRMVCSVMRGKVSKDFFEWEPSRLDLITDSMADSYFSKLDDDNWRDLKLPARSNLPVHAIAKL
ncbi:hypothetical protein RJ639_006611 [Escallonia herrerae]|uniref:3-hydroxyisobutyryl-CoA hydrolase n=1 Tax=Escallonia herrerae TaxID=1293975 RepID=A0AA88VUA8_9ASTE|nr:hypothetical protein RJ639_006611 [Escallonia herrerae]